MANPSVPTIKENTVQKIATNVKSLTIYKHRNSSKVSYYITTRATGEEKPSSSRMQFEGNEIFLNSNYYEIKSPDAVDVYIYCSNADGDSSDDGKLILWTESSLSDIQTASESILAKNTEIQTDTENTYNTIYGILSNSQKAIVSTTFADDYDARGYAFQAQRRITLGNGATTYLVLDTTACIENSRIVLLPLIMQTGGGMVFVDTYKITSYTGGSTIPLVNLNGTSDNVAKSILKTGVTPTGTPGSDLREYLVGTSSTRQDSGGGSIQPDLPKRFPAGSIIVAKLVNQESDTVYVSFGIIVYEVPVE